MASTEAQKRASAKYNRDKTKVFQLRFFPSDMELYEHLREQPNMAGYLKSLIRADMEAGPHRDQRPITL